MYIVESRIVECVDTCLDCHLHRHNLAFFNVCLDHFTVGRSRALLFGPQEVSG